MSENYKPEGYRDIWYTPGQEVPVPLDLGDSATLEEAIYHTRVQGLPPGVTDSLVACRKLYHENARLHDRLFQLQAYAVVVTALLFAVMLFAAYALWGR
jgi:hypothetical protein